MAELRLGWLILVPGDGNLRFVTPSMGRKYQVVERRECYRHILCRAFISPFVFDRKI
jgi:hypothetical protein